MTHAFANHPYARMNGAGNEIIVLDLRAGQLAMTPDVSRAIGRGEGLRFDQLMVLNAPRTPGTEAFVTIWNIDGSQAGACGNGTRCVAWTLLRDESRRDIVVETAAGLLACTRIADMAFTVDMGAPRFGWADIPLAHAVHDTAQVETGAPGMPPAAMASMGNPHAVFFLDDLAAHDLASLGPALEHHALFPQRANISFAQVLSRQNIKMRVWERGVGFTRACGSGACAVLVSAVRCDLAERKATVRLPGGDLLIEWRAGDNHVLMTGPVELEREGRLDPALFETVPA